MTREVFLSVWPSVRAEWLALYPHTENILSMVEAQTSSNPQLRINYLTQVLDGLECRQTSTESMRSETRSILERVDKIRSMFENLSDILQ